MQVDEHYDIVVVGDQLSGFFFAAGAAQAGFKVLVIEGTTSSTAIYEGSSGNFLTDINWEPVIGISPDSKLSGFLKSLGLYQEIDDLFPAFNPPVQLVSPRARIDYSYEKSTLQKEFEREFPKNASLQKLAEKMHHPQNEKYFADVVEKTGLGVEWEQLGNIQAALYGSFLPEHLRTNTCQSLIRRANSSVRYVMGGRSALKERLVGRLQVFGGKLKRNTWVNEIIFEKNKLSGVVLSSFEGFVRCSLVVGAMGANSFLKLVPSENRSTAILAEASAISPRFWRMTFSLRVPASVIPEGLAPHACFHDLNKDLSEENFLQVQTLTNKVYGGLLPDQRILMIRVLMPYDQKSLETHYIKDVIELSIETLKKHIPFLEGNILGVSPDFKNLEQDSVFQKYFKFKELSFIPPPYLVYETMKDMPGDQGIPSNWAMHGIHGLALCSRDVFPLYGLLGEILAATNLIEEITRKQKKDSK